MRGFSPRSSQSCFSAVSIAAALQGSTTSSAAAAASRIARVEKDWIGFDVVEEEAREAGELVEPRDLLLDDRRCSADEVVRPVGALLAEVLDQARRVRVGGERAQVHAVHPVELRVVERRRARPDALEREPLDQLVGRHDRRLAVRGPAQEREEVHERFGDVSRSSELVDGHGPVALRELLAVRAEDVRDVGVDGRLRSERAQHVHLLRRVGDVVVAADDVRDAVEPILER